MRKCFLLLAALAILVGCAAPVPVPHSPELAASFALSEKPPPAMLSEIVLFRYSNGTSSVGNTYTVERTGDEAQFTARSFSGGTYERDVHKAVPVAIFDELQRIVEEENLYEWPEKDTSTLATPGSYFVGLTIEYRDGSILRVYTEDFPDNYEQANKRICEYLDTFI